MAHAGTNSFRELLLDVAVPFDFVDRHSGQRSGLRRASLRSASAKPVCRFGSARPPAGLGLRPWREGADDLPSSTRSLMMRSE
jgi:hypothetical protein